MKLTGRMENGLHVLLNRASNGWTIGWGTFRALERRGLATKCRRFDFVRLTPSGRRVARALEAKRKECSE